MHSERRRFGRDPAHKRANVVSNRWGRKERFPCLVIDRSAEGFRLSGVFHIKRGESIEIILDDDPLSAVACTVVWVGRAGTKQEGEVGLQTV